MPEGPTPQPPSRPPEHPGAAAPATPPSPPLHPDAIPPQPQGLAAAPPPMPPAAAPPPPPPGAAQPQGFATDLEPQPVEPHDVHAGHGASLNDERYNIDTRPCLNCNGELEFSIADQKLKCPHCGSMQDIVVAPGAVVAEQAFTDALRAAHGRGNRLQHLAGEKEVVCQNCGGHTTFFGTLTSTRCPYCATPIQRTDVHEAPDRLAVDGVLPFHVDEAAANTLMKQWVEKRWFAPNDFKKYSTAGSFTSIYTAYFTFDADASTEYSGERGRTTTRRVGSGKDARTVTTTSWRPARGRVENVFDDVTVLGNTGLESKFVDKLEPWPTQYVQPFSPDYMAGHLAKSYDKDIEQCFDEAAVVMGHEIDRTICHDIGGDAQRIHSKRTSFYNKTYKHVLLPIWLLTVLYDGQPWQVFVNGATGEIHGERPYSKAKIVAAVVAALVVIAILITINQQGKQ